jgi:hypothetical protein
MDDVTQAVQERDLAKLRQLVLEDHSNFETSMELAVDRGLVDVVAFLLDSTTYTDTPFKTPSEYPQKIMHAVHSAVEKYQRDIIELFVTVFSEDPSNRWKICYHCNCLECNLARGSGSSSRGSDVLEIALKSGCQKDIVALLVNADHSVTSRHMKLAMEKSDIESRDIVRRQFGATTNFYETAEEHYESVRFMELDKWQREQRSKQFIKITPFKSTGFGSELPKSKAQKDYETAVHKIESAAFYYELVVQEVLDQNIDFRNLMLTDVATFAKYQRTYHELIERREKDFLEIPSLELLAPYLE